MTSLWLDRSRTIETDKFIADTAYDEVVVGAGLTGLVTATLLARAGHRVAVLEARHVGAVTTGNTTAKLSLLQGTMLSKIVKHHSEKVAAAYVEGNREAQAWALRYCEDNDIPVQRRDAYTYAGKRSGKSSVGKEYDIAQRVGLEVEQVDADELYEVLDQVAEGETLTLRVVRGTDDLTVTVSFGETGAEQVGSA